MTKKAKRRHFQRKAKDAGTFTHHAPTETRLNPEMYDLPVIDEDQLVEQAAQRLADAYLANGNKKIPREQHRLFYLGIRLELRDQVTTRAQQLLTKAKYSPAARRQRGEEVL